MQKTDIANPEQIDVVYAVRADIFAMLAGVSGTKARGIIAKLKALDEKNRLYARQVFRAIERLGQADAINAVLAQLAEEDPASPAE